MALLGQTTIEVRKNAGTKLQAMCGAVLACGRTGGMGTTMEWAYFAVPNDAVNFAGESAP